MAKKKTAPAAEMIITELPGGKVRLTASGGVLRHKATGRVHSEAVVKPESVKLFEVI